MPMKHLPGYGHEWVAYDLKPSDLLVNTNDLSKRGYLSICWKGKADMSSLAAFFKKAIEATEGLSAEVLLVSVPETGDLKTSIVPVTNIESTAPQYFSDAGFLRCDADVRSKDIRLSLNANLDDKADNLDNLQQMVSLYIHPSDIPKIEDELAEVIASTHSSFFPLGQTYNKDEARHQLREIVRDFTP